MDRENILSEGFFDKFKKAFSKQKNDKKTKEIYSKNKRVQKQYEKAMNAAQDALELGRKLGKKYGIPPIKY